MDNRQEQIEQVISKAVAEQPEKEKAGATIQIIIFSLDKEEYALPITEVREIIKTPEITPLPNAPSFISGITNVRGKIVTVIDLEKRFNLKRENKLPSNHIIISDLGDQSYGLIVDAVTEVLTLPKQLIEEAPEPVAEKISADYIQGVAVFEDRLIMLLNIGEILSEKRITEAATKLSQQVEKETEEQKNKKTEKPEGGEQANKLTS
jgi:purine-binding chemotaxis protein CheW